MAHLRGGFGEAPPNNTSGEERLIPKSQPLQVGRASTMPCRVSGVAVLDPADDVLRSHLGDVKILRIACEHFQDRHHQLRIDQFLIVEVNLDSGEDGRQAKNVIPGSILQGSYVLLDVSDALKNSGEVLRALVPCIVKLHLVFLAVMAVDEGLHSQIGDVLLALQLE